MPDININDPNSPLYKMFHTDHIYPFNIDKCPLCMSPLDQFYAMGLQSFTFDCPNCLDDDGKTKYWVCFYWAEHIGQKHMWVQKCYSETNKVFVLQEYEE